MANKHVNLILDSNNQIAGAALVDDSHDNKVSVQVTPLPGQTIHRVELPEEFINHLDFHRLASQLLYFQNGVAKIRVLSTK